MTTEETSNNNQQPNEPRKIKCNLYWVTTPDHDEDWFIFAKTKRSAERFHENYEGYDGAGHGYVTAELIVAKVEIDEILNECGTRARHAQLDDLKCLGFTDHTKDQLRRVVAYQDYTFHEGTMEARLEAALRNRPKPKKTISINREKLINAYEAISNELNLLERDRVTAIEHLVAEQWREVVERESYGKQALVDRHPEGPVQYKKQLHIEEAPAEFLRRLRLIAERLESIRQVSAYVRKPEQQRGLQ